MKIEGEEPKKRYYAKMMAPQKYWMVNWLTAWIIFDRGQPPQPGKIRDIALCANGQTATKIVDALNSYKESENE